MVLLNATRYFNRFLGPFLLKNGVRLRRRFLDKGTDQPTLDAVLGITLGRWLVGLEARDQAIDLIQEMQSKKSSSSNDLPLSLDREAAIRVQVLDDYVRPALLPNESWSEDVVAHWQFYPRLVRWLRSEYLSARFGPHVQAARQAFPALIQSPQFSIDIPPIYQNLPKSSLVRSALCIADGDGNGKRNKHAAETWAWASSKDRGALIKSMQSIAARYGGKTQVVRGGALCWNELPEKTSTKDMSLSDILQLLGASVQVCGPLNTWLEQRRQFQFWTREYIATLGQYILERCNGHSNVTVLEVGAGDGLLTALLQDYLQDHSSVASKKVKGLAEKRPKSSPLTTDSSSVLTFVATDNESWSIRKKATVVKLDYRQALEKYAREDGNPVIVLCSWMPMNDDWTVDFRANTAVTEYILIGEADDGQCGDHWETWGNPEFNERGDSSAIAPFERDGFERRDLVSLLPYQFSRYDSAISKEGTTVSFRRKL